MNSNIIKRTLALLLAAGLLAASCGSDAATTSAGDDQTAESTESTDSTETTEPTGTDEAAVSEQATGDDAATSGSFQIEVWADNWMAVYVDGVLIGEDSVSITTERSFNSEVFTFDAALPFTMAIEAKDFKETDSGIEYIGENNQQMGDGGIIAQVTNLSTGEIVAVTDAGWAALVVHQAPLNTECVNDADPDSTCEFLIIDTPSDWTSAAFDDSEWSSATVWSASDVDPKQGYDEIDWDGSAELIWGTDLEVDNTVLLRQTIS